MAPLRVTVARRQGTASPAQPARSERDAAAASSRPPAAAIAAPAPFPHPRALPGPAALARLRPAPLPVPRPPPRGPPHGGPAEARPGQGLVLRRLRRGTNAKWFIRLAGVK